MTRTASSARRKPPKQGALLTPAQVRKDKTWGPLLRGQIPGFDPCALAGDCRFDVAAAQDVLSFFPAVLRHSEPPVSGQPFELQPWQQSIWANFFGWKRPDGLRRFKTTFIYIPKKNVKTEQVAGIVLYVMGMCPRGSKLYACASSQGQAGYLADHAFGMVAQHPALSKRYMIYGEKPGTVRKSLTWHEKMVSFRILASDADTVDGGGPYFVAIDELHRHADGELASVLTKGCAAQREPIIVYTSTADYDRESPCNTLLARARHVRDNPGDPAKPGFDPTFLPALWEAPKNADWEDLEIWKKTNPNFGVSVTEGFCREMIQTAREQPHELNDVLRLHLNIVVGAANGWLNLTEWDRASPAVTLDPAARDEWVKDLGLEGRECYLGIDLGKVSDLTAVAAVFPGLEAADPWHVLLRYWMPERRLVAAEKRDRVPLSTWVSQGWLQMVEGDAMDYEAVYEYVVKLGKQVVFRDVAYDPWNGAALAQQLARQEVPVVEFRQGPKSYNEGCLKLVELIRRKLLGHGHNPVLRWNAGNVVVKKDDNQSISPSKGRSTGRIDGISALCMALSCSILGGVDQAQSAQEALLEDPIYE